MISIFVSDMTWKFYTSTSPAWLTSHAERTRNMLLIWFTFLHNIPTCLIGRWGKRRAAALLQVILRLGIPVIATKQTTFSFFLYSQKPNHLSGSRAQCFSTVDGNALQLYSHPLWILSIVSFHIRFHLRNGRFSFHCLLRVCPAQTWLL
jgi:hypothetical protein